MPYIEQQQRTRLDIFIAALADEVKRLGSTKDDKTDFSGILNYCITTLILRVIPERRYWAIALVTGVIQNVQQEFYRRYAAEYEDEKINSNGDVY